LNGVPQTSAPPPSPLSPGAVPNILLDPPSPGRATLVGDGGRCKFGSTIEALDAPDPADVESLVELDERELLG